MDMQIVTLLRGDKHLMQFPRARGNRPLERTYSEELLDAHEYNSTKYLTQLKRHQEIALGMES